MAEMPCRSMAGDRESTVAPLGTLPGRLKLGGPEVATGIHARVQNTQNPNVTPLRMMNDAIEDQVASDWK